MHELQLIDDNEVFPQEQLHNLDRITLDLYVRIGADDHVDQRDVPAELFRIWEGTEQ